MGYVLIFAFLCSFILGVITELPSKLGCDELGDCISTPGNCKELCGCDNIYFYNKTTNECELNLEYINSFTEKYHSQDMLEKESEEVFGGIIIALIFFVSCVSVCAVTAFVYCCRMVYTDGKLRDDVKALARKLERDGKIKKSQRKPLPPMAESCNVIVEDAGVYVC